MPVGDVGGRGMFSGQEMAAGLSGSSTSWSSVAPARAGWSDRCGYRWAGRDCVEGLPALGPWPLGWQVQEESTPGRGDPAGDLDDLATEARPSCSGQISSDRSGAGDVERDHRAGDPGCLLYT